MENKVARWVPRGLIFVSANNRLLPDTGPLDQAREFVRQAKALGVRAELSPQPMSHREINQALGLDNDETEVVEALMASLDTGIRRRLGR